MHFYVEMLHYKSYGQAKNMSIGMCIHIYKKQFLPTLVFQEKQKKEDFCQLSDALAGKSTISIPMGAALSRILLHVCRQSQIALTSSSKETVVRKGTTRRELQLQLQSANQSRLLSSQPTTQARSVTNYNKPH